MSPTLVIVCCLIHFLWQGALGALIAVLTLNGTRRSEFRYPILCSILFALALSPVGTYYFLKDAPVELGIGAISLGSHLGQAAAIVWLAGAGVGLVHLGICSAALAFPRSDAKVRSEVEEVVHAWAERLGIRRRVSVAVNFRLEAPAVAGIGKLCVYLPLSVVTRLSPQQLEAIVVHELVHIRRYDHIVNLIQACIERLYFFHPAVWWISRQIRIEREFLCDEQTLRLLPDRLVYATALAKLEELRPRPVVTPALAGNGGELVERIARILKSDRRSKPVLRLPVSGFMVCIAFLLLSFANAVPQDAAWKRFVALEEARKAMAWRARMVAEGRRAEHLAAEALRMNPPQKPIFYSKERLPAPAPSTK